MYTPELKQKVVNLCAETIKAHERTFPDYKKKVDYLIARYENELREDSITAMTDTKATLGAAFSLVENATPRINSRRAKYKYLAREGSDEPAAELYEEYSEWQFEESGAESELDEVVTLAGITGLAGWKMGWKVTKKIVSKNGKEVLGYKITSPTAIKVLEKLGAGKNIKVDEEQVTANYTFDSIHPKDLIWSVEAKKIKDAPVLGHKFTRRLDQLEDNGFDVSELVAEKIDNPDESDKPEGETNDPYMDSVTGAELYVEFEHEGMIRSFVVTMAKMDNPICIGFQENPYDMQFRPIGFYRPIKRPGKLPGFGVIEPSMGQINVEEDTINMAATALWTDISKPMEYDPSNIIDIDALEYGARVLVPVRNLGKSVAVMPTPQVPTGTVSFFANYFNKSKQNTSGITDYQSGSEQLGGDKTLGEIQIKTAESNTRIAKMARNFEMEVLEPMGRYALYMNQQFLRDNKKMIFRILGRKGEVLEKKIKFNDIEAIKDVVVVGGSGSLALQQFAFQKWVAILDRAYIEEKSANPVKINKEPMWEKLLSDGAMIKDVETYIPSLRDIEEEDVKGKVAQVKDAKEENAQPMTAKVLPSDDPNIHIQLHKAEIERRTREIEMAKGKGIEVPPEIIQELQLLMVHLDDHVKQTGGMATATEGLQVGQGTDPNQPEQPTQTNETP